jgi:hypothetical protein
MDYAKALYYCTSAADADDAWAISCGLLLHIWLGNK